MENHTIEQSDDACADCRLPTDEDVAAFLNAIRAFSGKWKVRILCLLVDGPRRFGELRRALPGVTQQMLTMQLRELEQSGLVLRTVFAEVPPRVEYELTEAAYALQPMFNGLVAWSLRYRVSARSGKANAQRKRALPLREAPGE